MSKLVKYNIPGNGNINALLFAHTESIIEFLENYNHISKLKNINQLGRLLNVYPGAHHTRYEYVFLQLALVTELVKQKGNHGLSIEREFYGEIDSLGKHPSSAELLQCIIIVANIGYSEATFAANRAWLNVINRDKDLKRVFRSGLPEEAKEIFEQVVGNFDFYKFQHLVTIYLLQRYKKTSNGHVEFLTNILIGYLNKERDSLHKIRLWELFKNIRRIAFLTLDSLYAPVPFSIRLSSIVLSFDEYHEDMILKETSYSQALSELELVLQNSIYLSPSSILCTSKSTNEIITKLEKQKDSFLKISTLKKLLQDSENDKTSLMKIDWNEEQILSLNFENAKGFFPKEILKAPVEWEKGIINNVGKTKINLAIAPNPNGDNVKIAISVIPESYKDRLNTVLKTVGVVHSVFKSLPSGYNNPLEIENSLKLLDLILKSIFGWDKRFMLELGDKRYNPVFIADGKAKMKKAINDFYNNMSTILNADQLFEIKQLENTVEKYGYSGLMLCFAGATKVLSLNQNNLDAEFDGILLKPNLSICDDYLFVVEAKNQTGGYTAAHTQLQMRLGKVLPENVLHTIEKLNPKAAVAKIKTI